jgi:hypothetical protein
LISEADLALYRCDVERADVRKIGLRPGRPPQAYAFVRGQVYEVVERSGLPEQPALTPPCTEAACMDYVFLGLDALGTTTAPVRSM